MPYTEKQTFERINRTADAWDEHADEAKFANLTLDQFKAKVKPALDCRVKIANLRLQLQAALKRRAECDVVANEYCAKVVNAVRGDVDYGDDSALYKALGYVPKSERRSGLRRSVSATKAA